MLTALIELISYLSSFINLEELLKKIKYLFLLYSNYYENMVRYRGKGEFTDSAVWCLAPLKQKMTPTQNLGYEFHELERKKSWKGFFYKWLWYGRSKYNRCLNAFRSEFRVNPKHVDVDRIENVRAKNLGKIIPVEKYKFDLKFLVNLYTLKNFLDSNPDPGDNPPAHLFHQDYYYELERKNKFVRLNDKLLDRISIINYPVNFKEYTHIVEYKHYKPWENYVSKSVIYDGVKWKKLKGLEAMKFDLCFKHELENPENSKYIRCFLLNNNYEYELVKIKKKDTGRLFEILKRLELYYDMNRDNVKLCEIIVQQQTEVENIIRNSLEHNMENNYYIIHEYDAIMGRMVYRTIKLDSFEARYVHYHQLKEKYNELKEINGNFDYVDISIRILETSFINEWIAYSKKHPNYFFSCDNNDKINVYVFHNDYDINDYIRIRNKLAENSRACKRDIIEQFAINDLNRFDDLNINKLREWQNQANNVDTYIYFDENSNLAIKDVRNNVEERYMLYHVIRENLATNVTNNELIKEMLRRSKENLIYGMPGYDEGFLQLFNENSSDHGDESSSYYIEDTNESSSDFDENNILVPVAEVIVDNVGLNHVLAVEVPNVQEEVHNVPLEVSNIPTEENNLPMNVPQIEGNVVVCKDYFKIRNENIVSSKVSDYINCNIIDSNYIVIDDINFNLSKEKRQVIKLMIKDYTVMLKDRNLNDATRQLINSSINYMNVIINPNRSNNEISNLLEFMNQTSNLNYKEIVGEEIVVYKELIENFVLNIVKTPRSFESWNLRLRIISEIERNPGYISSNERINNSNVNISERIYISENINNSNVNVSNERINNSNVNVNNEKVKTLVEMINKSGSSLNEIQFKDSLKALFIDRTLDKDFDFDKIAFYFPIKDNNGLVDLKLFELDYSDLNLIKENIKLLYDYSLKSSNLYLKLFCENEIDHIKNGVYIKNYKLMYDIVLNFKKLYYLKKDFFKIGFDYIGSINGKTTVDWIYNENFLIKLIDLIVEDKTNIYDNYKNLKFEEQIRYVERLNLLNNFYDYLKSIDFCFSEVSDISIFDDKRILPIYSDDIDEIYDNIQIYVKNFQEILKFDLFDAWDYVENRTEIDIKDFPEHYNQLFSYELENNLKKFKELTNYIRNDAISGKNTLRFRNNISIQFKVVDNYYLTISKFNNKICNEQVYILFLLDDYLACKYKSWYSFIFKKYMLINGNEKFLKIHNDFLKIKKNIHWWRLKYKLYLHLFDDK